MRIGFVVSIIFMGFIATGCGGGRAVVLGHTPLLSKFDKPEVPGEFKGGVALSKVRAVVVEEASLKTEVKDFHNMYNDQQVLGGRLDVGFSSFLSGYYRNYEDTVEVLGLKAQLVGAPKDKRDHGFKMTAAVEAGYFHGITDRENEREAFVHIESFDFSVNSGYRINRHLLWYANLFYNHYNFYGELLSNQQVLFSERKNNRYFGPLVGLNIDFDAGFHLTLEWGRVRLLSPGERSAFTYPFGLSAGFSW